MEIAPGIHRIDLTYAPLGLATYALLGERVVLVDAGYAGAAPQIDAYLRRVGRTLAEVSACVFTHAHADHYGGASEVRAAAPQVTFCAHPLDRAWVEDPEAHIRENYLWPESYGLPLAPQVLDRVRGMLGPGVQVQTILTDGDTVDVGSGWRLDVMHAPGHTAGHIALHDRRSNSLVAGDAVLEPAVLPPSYFDALIYIDTQDRLSRIGVNRLLGCHYPVKEGRDAGEFIRRAREHAVECHRVVGDVMTSSPQPVHLVVIAEALRGHFGLGDAPQRWVWCAQGHLAALERTGDVIRRPHDGLPAWERRR